jgi:23S rRNA-/tRNA-specific pseudouridylate synthase
VVGAVRVDGRTVRQPGRPLRPRARVEALVRGPVVRRPADRAFEITPAVILYEDDVLIAIDKPPGLPTPPTVDAARPSVVGALKLYLGPKAYVGIHQRLDRETSGVVVFTKHPKANPGLARAFADRSIVKVYAALAHAGDAAHPDAWTSTSRLSRGEGTPPRVSVVDAGRSARGDPLPDRAPAERARGCSRHGRTRGASTRFAFSSPASARRSLGTALYGGKNEIAGQPVPRVLLHARRLELTHPLSGQPMRIESPLPEDFTRVLNAVS